MFVCCLTNLFSAWDAFRHLCTFVWLILWFILKWWDAFMYLRLTYSMIYSQRGKHLSSLKFQIYYEISNANHYIITSLSCCIITYIFIWRKGFSWKDLSCNQEFRSGYHDGNEQFRDRCHQFPWCGTEIFPECSPNNPEKRKKSSKCRFGLVSGK